MKRSINSENLIVVTALAIAVSLLASACGPSTMKTLKARTGVKVFSDKMAIAVEEEEVKTQSDQVLQVIQEKRASDGKSIVDVKAVEQLAARIQYVQYLTEVDKSNIVFAVINKDSKQYRLKFMNGEYTDDGLRIEYSKPVSAKEIIDNKEVGAEVNLNISARVQKSSENSQNIVIVSLYEKTTNAQKVTATTEVAILVKVNQATADVNSKDENLLKMKDQFVDTRISQVYISDDGVLEGNVKKLASPANRIIIKVSNKESGSLIYSFASVLSLESNDSKVNFNDVSQDLIATFNNSTFSSMSLKSGTELINADQFTLLFENKKTKEVSNVLLTLSDLYKSEADVDNSAAEEAEAAAEETAPASSDSAQPAATDDKAQAQPDAATATDDDADAENDFVQDATPIVTAPTAPSTQNAGTDKPKILVPMTPKTIVIPKPTVVAPKVEAPKTALQTVGTVIANDVKIGKAVVNASPQVAGYKVASAVIAAPIGGKTAAGTAALGQAMRQSREATIVGVQAARENLAIAGKAAASVANSPAGRTAIAVATAPIAIAGKAYEVGQAAGQAVRQALTAPPAAKPKTATRPVITSGAAKPKDSAPVAPISGGSMKRRSQIKQAK